jgi:hypothetical protein
MARRAGGVLSVFLFLACSSDPPGAGVEAGRDVSLDGTDAGSRDDVALPPDGEDVIDADADVAPSDVDAKTGGDGETDADATIDADASGSDVMFDRRAPRDASCPGTPVREGETCTVEGTIACGWERSCTDVDSPFTTDCICRNGRYSCGECPFCNIDLRLRGCGIGQVCDGVAFTLCSGAQETVNETCSCMIGSSSSSWVCGTKTYRMGECSDGGDAAP